jgi:hypothetical protein
MRLADLQAQTCKIAKARKDCKRFLWATFLGGDALSVVTSNDLSGQYPNRMAAQKLNRCV